MARVLIVDDSKIMRITIRALLEDIGHEVVGEAVNGLDGYDQYFALKPEILTIDLSMPVMDGIATIHKIMEKDKDAKIIMLTSNTNNEKLEEGLDAGVCEILFKPVDGNQLREAIDRITQSD